LAIFQKRKMQMLLLLPHDHGTTMTIPLDHTRTVIDPSILEMSRTTMLPAPPVILSVGEGPPVHVSQNRKGTQSTSIVWRLHRPIAMPTSIVCEHSRFVRVMTISVVATGRRTMMMMSSAAVDHRLVGLV
jgi:hypothetical protein